MGKFILLASLLLLLVVYTQGKSFFLKDISYFPCSSTLYRRSRKIFSFVKKRLFVLYVLKCTHIKLVQFVLTLNFEA